jgi:hypothetical protein
MDCSAMMSFPCLPACASESEGISVVVVPDEICPAAESAVFIEPVEEVRDAGVGELNGCTLTAKASCAGTTVEWPPAAMNEVRNAAKFPCAGNNLRGGVLPGAALI